MIGHPSVMSCFSISIKNMERYIYRVTLLLKEYTFIYLPHDRGFRTEVGQMNIKLQNILIIDSSLD